MSWREYLFSFQGRVTRSKFWLLNILAVLVIGVVTFAIIALAGLVSPQSGDSLSPAQIISFIIAGAAFLLIIWISIAVGVKRCHDRIKSGWWLLVGLIPYIGGLWQFVELGCLRGTRGRNRFGPDALSPDDMITQKIFE